MVLAAIFSGVAGEEFSLASFGAHVPWLAGSTLFTSNDSATSISPGMCSSGGEGNYGLTLARQVLWL